MLVLSPRAVARLEGYQPSWPLPKLFQLTSAAAERGHLSRRYDPTRHHFSVWRMQSIPCAGGVGRGLWPV